MKVILIFIIFSLVSCSTTKKVDHATKVDERINQSVAEEKQVQTETSSNIEMKTEETEKDTEEYLAKFLTFDTSLPVNQVTGRAPVSSELIILKSKNLDRRIESNLTIENQSDIRTVEYSDYKSDFSQKRDSTSVQKEAKGFEKNCTDLILFLLTLVVVVFLCFMNRKVLLRIFQKITRR